MSPARLDAAIHRAKAESGVKIKRLVAYLDIDAKTLSNWRRGVGCPDGNELLKLAAYLEVPLADLTEPDTGEE